VLRPVYQRHGNQYILTSFFFSFRQSLLFLQSDTFRVIPVRKWVNFARDWDAYKEDPELNQLQQQQQQMAIKAEAKSVGMTVIKNEVKSEAGVVSASDIFSGRLNRVAGASAAKLKRERTDDDGEMVLFLSRKNMHS